MGFLKKVGEVVTKSLEKIGKKEEAALNLISAVAKNPFAILAPIKEAKKIEKLREDIAAGDKKAAGTYVKTVATQTALNIGATLAGAGALGAAAAKTATTLGSKAITAGVIAAPFIVGSDTIRETVAATSPIELGIKAGEKLESAIQTGDEKAEGVANVVGLLAAGATGAALLKGVEMLLEDIKDGGLIDNKVLETPTVATAPSAPVTAATTNLTPTTKAGGSSTSRKRKRRPKSPQIPSINIKIDDRDFYCSNRKLYKGGRC